VEMFERVRATPWLDRARVASPAPGEAAVA